MPGQIQNPNAGLEPPANFPQHLFASAGSSIDMRQVKPHACAERIEQRGNYIHCLNGNHGMRIPHGKVLNQDASGNWILEDIIVRDSDGQPLTDDHGGQITLQQFVKAQAL